MIIALLLLLALFFWLRPLERWEGTITRRANETKVPREVILALDLASLPLMLVVTFGLPSAIVLVPPGQIGIALGFKDILSEMFFWGFSACFAYLSLSVARILICMAWSFYGFAPLKLYSRNGWLSSVTYLLIPFLILGPVTKATNIMLTNAMGGLLSAVEGSINYVPVLFFLTLFNVAMVVNGILKAPSQGQYLLTYFTALFGAVADTHINAVYRNAANGVLSELPMLADFGADYEEVPITDARRLLEKAGGRAARGLGRFMVRNKKSGEYALSPEARDVITPDADGKVHFN